MEFRRSPDSSRRPRIRIAAALASAWIVGLSGVGCESTGEDGVGDHPDALPEREAAVAVELGAPAADALADGVFGGLNRARDELGLVGALEFCSAEALGLTEEIQESHDPRLDLKRTTLRWRNPANAPDAWEERILDYLARLERNDPDSVPGELTARGPDETLRYYRVLRTVPMCLNCHGAIPGMAPDVRESIRQRYPDDRATGYREGEVRGVVRVEIPAAVVTSSPEP